MNKQISNIGEGAIKYLPEILRKLGANSIFLVSGKNSFKISGAKGFLFSFKNEFSFTHFYEFSINPKFEEALKGVELFSSRKHDLILAIGGGSVLDMAKLIKIFSNNIDKAKSIVEDKYAATPNKINFIACPTTSGTGSECTHFAVVYFNKTKYSVAHEELIPDYAIVDPELTKSLPPSVIAFTGLDALCQSIEAYWSVNSNNLSDNFAERAIQLTSQNLCRAVNNQDRLSSRKMAEGAFLSGKAINITKTTAPHALSYYLTSKYGIAHGHAVALFLPLIFDYNFNVKKQECNDSRGVSFVKDKLISLCQIMNISNPSEFRIRFENILNTIKVEPRLSSFNFFNKRNIKVIIENVNFERMGNNPRKLDSDELFRLLYYSNLKR